MVGEYSPLPQNGRPMVARIKTMLHHNQTAGASPSPTKCYIALGHLIHPRRNVCRPPSPTGEGKTAWRNCGRKGGRGKRLKICVGKFSSVYAPSSTFCKFTAAWFLLGGFAKQNYSFICTSKEKLANPYCHDRHIVASFVLLLCSFEDRTGNRSK